MRLLRLQCDAASKDLLVAELWEHATRGLIEEEQPGGRYSLAAFFDEEFPVEAFRAFSPRWEAADETNWARRIMDEWEPVLAGERFFIVPDWRDEPTPPGRLRLEVHPGVALGTGYHATTQMCLEAMERWLRPGDRFLDLGCGAGILSQAAWLLGERHILACDTDPQATSSAVENLRRARVPVRLFTGSITAVSDAAADFLAANISAATLVELAPEIRRALRPGGRAVLSGFSPEEAGAVHAAFRGAGFRALGSGARDGWASYLAARDAPP